MKVEKIYTNYKEIDRRPKAQKYSSNVSFGKKPPNYSSKIMESIADSKILKFMKEKLSWMKGEFGGVAMTAAGTGLVAPWPIAFNPLVKPKKDATDEEKEDLKNTKYYTAWRQPISAVLAAIFQLGALKPIDKFLNYLYNNPETAKMFDVDTNQSVLNNDGYIKGLAKKEMKAEGLSKASMGKAEFEKELKSRVGKIREEQLERLANSIKETHQIQVGKEFIDNSKVADIVNKEINEYIRDAEKLKIDKQGLKFYSERAKVLVENESFLKDLLKNAPKEGVELETYLKNLLSKETNMDRKLLIEEILDREPQIRYHRIKRSVSRINKIKHLCGGNYSFDNYMEAMTKRNAEIDKIITKFELAKIKDLKSATPKEIKKAIQSAIECCHFEDGKNPLQTSILRDTGTFNTKKEKLVEKVYKDVAKGYKKFVQNSYKSHNQLWKIAIGVGITLPITCSVLNWVYPRFMDLCFPKLAGAKAKQKAREKEGK